MRRFEKCLQLGSLVRRAISSGSVVEQCVDKKSFRCVLPQMLMIQKEFWIRNESTGADTADLKRYFRGSTCAAHEQEEEEEEEHLELGSRLNDTSLDEMKRLNPELAEAMSSHMLNAECVIPRVVEPACLSLRPTGDCELTLSGAFSSLSFISVVRW